MDVSAFIKQEDGVETAKICRWCLSTGESLEPLTNDESRHCNLQKLSECSGFQANLLHGVPSFLCTKCESRLEKMYAFRWRCNKNIARVNGFTEKQNTAKNEADISKDHLGHSAEQTVGTELLIKTEVTAPDAANDLRLNQRSCTVHQVNEPYECCENKPLVAEETAIAIKLENVDVDEQYRLQRNPILDHEQDNLKAYPLELVYQDQEDHSMTNNMCAYGTKLSIKTEVATPDEAKDLSLNQRSCTAHQANRTYACYGNQPDDLFEAEENPIAIKSENEDIDEQDNIDINTLELVCQDRENPPATTNACVNDSASESSETIYRNANSKGYRNKQKHHCPHCSAIYLFSNQLKIHIRTHTGEKPYTCRTCENAFHSSSALAQHSKIHKKDEYLQCPYCSSKFPRSSTLKDHINTHTGVKPYVCKTCSKTFCSSGNLAQHSKIHNKDAHHQCPYCPSKFALLSGLKVHIRTHTGERLYACTICSKAFCSSGNLAKHSKIHKDEQHH